MNNRRIFLCTLLIFLSLCPVFGKSRNKNQGERGTEITLDKKNSGKNSKDSSKDSKELKEDKEIIEDMSLWEIRKLIRDTNYDEAFQLLTVYIKQNPENFDNAQRLVAMIMEAKKKYAENIDKLIVLISTDPDNDEEIYKVIKTLKKIEKHPSDASLAYVDNIDKVVTFSHNQKESSRIMTASADFISKEEYIQSLKVLQEGFVLYREEYEDRWGLESDILKQTDEIVASVNKSLEYFSLEDLYERINLAVQTFKDCIQREAYSESIEAYSSLSEFLGEYSSFRKQIYNDGLALRELNVHLQELPAAEESENSDSESEGEVQNDEDSATKKGISFFDSTDASYLPFITHFIFGDETQSISGIIPTLDTKYKKLVVDLNQTVFECVLKNYEKAFGFFDSNIATVSASEEEYSNLGFSENLEKYASLEKQVYGFETILYTDYELENSDKKINSLSDYGVLGDYLVNLTSESERIYKINAEINIIAAKQESIFQSLDSAKTNQEQSQLVSSLLDSTVSLGALVGIKNEQEIQNYQWSKEYKEKSFNNWDKLENLYGNYLNKIFDDSSKILNTGWEKIATYYKNCADNVVAEVTDNNPKTKEFSDGFGSKIPAASHKQFINDIASAFSYVQNDVSDQQDDIKYKYPDITLAMAGYTYKKIDGLVAQLNDYEKVILDNYNNHEQWKSDEGISALVQDSQSYFNSQRDKLQKIKTEANSLRDLSKKQIAAAEILKVDAEMDYDDAEASLKRENFENARNKLKACSEKYVRSFDIQSDEALSKECDEKIQSLGMKITRLENEKVVREVRELKTLAKAAYVDGRFDEAERYLSQAASRWGITNSEEDEEIVNLQVFVNTAVSTKTGREILPSAPQYEEMSQLLALAYQYYDAGESALKKGDKAASEEDFDNSESSIKQLQLVYPLHQEAALLSLKISKLRDPTKFNETFAQKIENARMMCKSKDESTKKEGYANLQDYYELDPNYKGLKNIIYQAEFDVGIRKNVDNGNLIKAKAAYNEANRYYKAGNLEAANRKITEALNLNPDDVASQKLKDSITIAIGGTKIPLTTDAQKLYSKSYDCFVQNNMEMAEFYLNRLAQLDKRYMNDDDVQRLKAKIDALK